MSTVSACRKEPPKQRDGPDFLCIGNQRKIRRDGATINKPLASKMLRIQCFQPGFGAATHDMRKPAHRDT